MEGSERSTSSCACSAARSASRSNTAYLPFMKLMLAGQAKRSRPDVRDGNVVTCLLAASSLLAEPALEPGHAAAGVENLLLAGVEGVTLRADVGVDDTVPRGAARLERVPAATHHGRVDVLRVDTGLHC